MCHRTLTLKAPFHKMIKLGLGREGGGREDRDGEYM